VTGVAERRQRGFSTVEVLVVMAMFGMILTLLAGLGRTGEVLFAEGSGKIRAQQDVRSALARAAFELRSAQGAAVEESEEGGVTQLTLTATKLVYDSGSDSWSQVDISFIWRDDTQELVLTVAGDSQVLVGGITAAGFAVSGNQVDLSLTCPEAGDQTFESSVCLRNGT